MVCLDGLLRSLLKVSTIQTNWMKNDVHNPKRLPIEVWVIWYILAQVVLCSVFVAIHKSVIQEVPECRVSLVKGDLAQLGLCAKAELCVSLISTGFATLFKGVDRVVYACAGKILVKIQPFLIPRMHC